MIADIVIPSFYKFSSVFARLPVPKFGGLSGFWRLSSGLIEVCFAQR